VYVQCARGAGRPDAEVLRSVPAGARTSRDAACHARNALGGARGCRGCSIYAADAGGPRARRRRDARGEASSTSGNESGG
jgi:hypothetical protein